MTDVSILPLSGVGDSTLTVSTEEVTTLNGSAVTAQKVQRAGIVLITANATAVDLPGDAVDGAKVQLPAATVAALTPPAAITGFSTSAKQDTLQASVGATTDAEAASGDGTLIAILKACRTKLASIVTALAGTLTISGNVTNAGTFAVQSTDTPASTANNSGSTVSIPASNTLALAAFATRKGGTIFAPIANAGTVYVSLGGTATSSGIPLGAGDSMPLNQGSGAYSGAIYALSSSGTQSLIVVEW